MVSGSQLYLWVSAAWVTISAILLCVVTELASDSDKRIVVQKNKYLLKEDQPEWTEDNRPPPTPIKEQVLDEKEEAKLL